MMIADRKVLRGETHRTVAGKGTETVATRQRDSVADDQNSLKVGASGPLEVRRFREKVLHFDHEREP